MDSSKVVLVTGASRGIGMAIAKDFVANGYNVVGTATSDAGVANINSYGAKGIILNVKSSIEDLKQKMQSISDCYGESPSILINNAGITNDKLSMRMTEDDWDAVITTNLTSVFKLSKLYATEMSKARWGRIINIGSIIGSIGNPGQCNYAAAKAGVEGLSKTLAREFASRNITVNVVAPGFIDTDMTKAMSEEQIKKLCEPIPMKTTGKPEDVSTLVLFIASDKASYITGHTFHVNGGLYMA